ncbi:MAG: hypothetical protein ACR2GY_07285 [Phycisphaerales bacterium]
MKRTIPLVIASITGIALILSVFVPATQDWGQKAMIWFSILAAAAFVLGAGSLLKMHLKKISAQDAGWAYSLITVLAFVITAYVGLFKVGSTPSAQFPGHAWSGEFNSSGSASLWIYNNLIDPITATMFAMLAFYIASASFRAFRAKNIEAILLLGTAFIVLLGRTYAGIWLTDWIAMDPASIQGTPSAWEQFAINIRLDRLVEIIMDVFNTAGRRAIMIGIALGIISTSLKVILGVDRSYLGTDRE